MMFSSGAWGKLYTQRKWRSEPPYAPLSNPQNPILAELREARKRGDDFTDAESVLARLDDMEAGSDAWTNTPEHIEHAERVLTRLARLEESENNS